MTVVGHMKMMAAGTAPSDMRDLGSGVQTLDCQQWHSFQAQLS